MAAPKTIYISTEAFNEFFNAMKAAGFETMPNQLTIKHDMSIAQPIDFRLATIRRDCLVEAVKLGGTEADIIPRSKAMFEFVIGKETKDGWK